MLRSLLLFCVLVSGLMVCAQEQKGVPSAVNRPKLVVGIVVDQMRWDYLRRYSDRFGETGFKRMLREGFSADNTFIPYTPTVTAAGHACIYTGSVPALNGIIGNDWFSRELNRDMYCVEDETVKPVGTASVAGKMSPKNLWATTISDEMRLATNFRSKTIGIALKDRGAILPAGHSANGAFWFDNATGGWITSSYYMNQLPEWMVKLNARKLPDQLMSKDWNTLLPAQSYRQSSADDKPFEGAVPGDGNTFPHATSSIRTDKYNAFRYTPMANTYTVETAMAAVEGESLGADEFTDMLAISFSTPDYIGHAFGPNSMEVEDNYLRLDQDLGRLLTYLDKKVGKGNYLVFLSADHGVAHVPAFLKENKIPAGILDDASVKRFLVDSIKQKFSIADPILFVMNYQVYLNYAAITDQKAVTEFIIRKLVERPEIAQAFALADSRYPLPDKVAERARNGYNQKLSGDIQFVLKPQYIDGGTKGSTHGAWNPYDARIPNLWFGWNIRHGQTNREVHMSDIAVTLAGLLNIQQPNASIGEAIPGILK